MVEPSVVHDRCQQLRGTAMHQSANIIRAAGSEQDDRSSEGEAERSENSWEQG
jgi:hypothetical protein